MNTLNGALLGLGGLAVGIWIGRYVVLQGVEGEVGRLVAERDAAVARAERAEAGSASARDSRRRPRDDRPAGEIPANTRVPSDPESVATAKSQPSTKEELSAADRQVKARAELALSRLDLQAAWAAHDGEKALELLKKLAAVARDLPEARDDAMKLAVDINQDVNGAGELHLSQFVYYSGLGDPAVKDLMMWSLDNPGATPPGFRVITAWSIPWTLKPDEAIARYDAALSQETDRNVQTAIVSNLSSMNTAKAEAVLTKVFADTTRDPALRGDAAMALATSKDPAVQRAIETAAQSDPEPKLQTAAKLSLIVRDPPATGILVTQVQPESNAEVSGIAPGDVIVSYNGRPVPTGDDLRREIGAVSGVETVGVVVVRNGRTQSIDVKPGRLGLPALQPVTKK